MGFNSKSPMGKESAASLATLTYKQAELSSRVVPSVDHSQTIYLGILTLLFRLSATKTSQKVLQQLNIAAS